MEVIIPISLLMKTINDNTNSQKGFTTTELLIASAMAVIVVGVAGVTLSDAKRSEFRANMSTSMLQEHTLNMQKSRSPEYIKQMLTQKPTQTVPSKGGSIYKDGPDLLEEIEISKGGSAGGGQPQPAINPDIASCFAGRPPAGGCAQFNGEYTRSWISDDQCRGAACDMKSQLVIELECGSERCSQVKAHVSSWADDDSWNLKRLSASTRLPASIFAAENSVNYGCASSGGVAVFRISGRNNVASCNGPSLPTACTGGQPLRAVAAANPASGGGIRQDPGFEVIDLPGPGFDEITPVEPGGGFSQFSFSQSESFEQEESRSVANSSTEQPQTCHQMASASCAGRSGVSNFRMISGSGSNPSNPCRL